ncbi:apolipoprotein N-acyltransferase [Rhodobacter sp. 24-YEA-8]|uniref:apolipoprotein N-acyltransferase n=1 Tax=Rhodobacter sp. 24-YEA-8 TaxID=1884310 RepID=UPI000894FA71|nr:apolipoprotein N-acyltransferase [Rhodobacter sp. 24-YEA-8]SEB48135.1 Apolipoprotein N-acyltransferase [Rhodobacter sp. 24-YEA-8]
MQPQRNRLWHQRLRDFVIGAVAALGLSPFGLWPVALVALALILRRVGAAKTGREAFWRGLFAGAGWFGLSLNWIVQPFFVDPWRHGWMAPFALLLIAFGLGLFWGLAGLIARRAGGGAMAFALALSLTELARGFVLTGFPWSLPGHIWLDTALVQMGALMGGYGMTALTLIALAAPFSYGWRRGGAVSTAILALGVGWSGYRLSLPEPAPRDTVLRIVQPNIAQNLKWDPEEARSNFTRLLSMTAGARADLVIWPETSVPYLVTEGDGAALSIAQAGGDALVVAGYQRDEGAAAWNTLGVFGPGGRISQTFDKIHLVPFGEYMPMGDLLYDRFGIRAFASQAGAGYSAGLARNLLDFGATGGRALPLICYEAIFPGDLVTDERPDWILQATNDAWFGTLTGPYQHFAQTRLRAIEQGLPLIRAANTGISAVVDARGFVATDREGQPARLGLGLQGVIDAQLPGPMAPPPYARMLRSVGEAPLLIFLLCGLLVRVLSARRRAAGRAGA